MHLLPSLILAQTSGGGSAFDEMLRLIGIAAIVFAFFKGIRLLLPKHPATPAAAQTAGPPAGGAATAAPAEATSPELLAVIAAAVATTTTNRHRIISIKRHSSHWEKAGRQSVLTSHRIR